MLSLNDKLSELEQLETEVIEALRIASKITSEVISDERNHEYALKYFVR